MMVIQSLKNVPLSTIIKTFNEAFTNYFVPLHLTPAAMERKMAVDRINLSLSAGAFSGKKLVGFILTGLDKIGNDIVAYNAGTGVISEHRGNGLTRMMYQYLFQEFKKHQVDRSVLEVIAENKAALKVYSSLGFKVKRTLNSYRGTVKPYALPTGYAISPLDRITRDMAAWCDWQPSWSHDFIAANLRHHIQAVQVLYDQKAVAYAAYHQPAGRVVQFAVSPAHRRHGIATALFGHIGTANPNLTVINVQQDQTATTGFLASMGMQQFITQCEMLLQPLPPH